MCKLRELCSGTAPEIELYIKKQTGTAIDWIGGLTESQQSCFDGMIDGGFVEFNQRRDHYDPTTFFLKIAVKDPDLRKTLRPE